MKVPFDVSDLDFRFLQQTLRSVQVGHHFLFAEDAKALKPTSRSARMSRLLAEEPRRPRLFPLVEKPVELMGVTLTPKPRPLQPLGCVVADRDLYRAEEDTVYLFIALPHLPRSGELGLVVRCNGEVLSERTLELADLAGGVGIETLSMLLPGSYTAQLVLDDSPLSAPVAFTVAEYTLAPLAARLLSHSLHRGEREPNLEELAFELSVDSYQVPFDSELDVFLMEGARVLSETRLKATEAGRYGGRLALVESEGPLRLQLVATADSSRVAEVAVPGSRAAERHVTVWSELGEEVLFSMMPEPQALPLRGGYLTRGDVLATPLVVEEVVAEAWVIEARTAVEALHLVTVDLASGERHVTEVGEVEAGDEVRVEPRGPMSTVVVGCVVGSRPFEGYTTFVQPSRLTLEVDSAETLRPGDDLAVHLKCGLGQTRQPVPVLLSVRDQRLTATDRPALSLGAAAKRALEETTSGMDERGFVGLHTLVPGGTAAPAVAAAAPMPAAGAGPDLEDTQPMAMLDMTPGSAPAAIPQVRPPEEDTGSYAVGEAFLSQIEEPAGEAEAAPQGAPRSEFPQVLFYGLVEVQGTQEVVIPLGDSLGTYTVEAFALSQGDWIEATRSLVVDQPVRVDLDLPTAVEAGDRVSGTLRVVTASGRGRVTLTRDGEAVSLPVTQGAQGEDGLRETPWEVELEVEPGTYLATVEDAESGESDSQELTVGTPGHLRSYARELGLLQAGESLTVDSAQALTLKVLPAVEESFDALVTTTASYSHLCCEQTAAKILAAVFMYLTAKNGGQRRKAEQIILAGIARERKMLRRGKGFTMYPGRGYVSDHYSRLAVRYLWTLDRLHELPDLSGSLRRAAKEGVAMADTAAAAHRMERTPSQIRRMDEAYALARAGSDPAAVMSFIDETLEFSGDQVRLKEAGNRVATRAALAYAAASLLALGRRTRGVRIANQVTRQFNQGGALYSTVDSVAAIALMIQLEASRLVGESARLKVNGREMTAMEATRLGDQVESVEVVEGVAAVEVTTIRDEDWNTCQFAFPVRVGFRDAKGAKGKKVKHFRMGDRVELSISLPDGYQVGDLVHVHLPACLSWIKGGGKVKRFTLDFEGKDELSVPLVVTGRIRGKEHFALCVRNMFEEERATSPGLMSVAAAP